MEIYHLAKLSGCFKKGAAIFAFIVICHTSAAQQGVQVKGEVTDSKDSSPLVGVSVVEKGTNKGASTDANGSYSLTASSANATLIFTYIGYATLEVSLQNRSEVNVKLEPATRGLEEVVVIGYGTQRKGDVTSAISSVKAEDFVKGNVRDAGQLIQGKVAGLQVSSPSGNPVEGTQIQLRGLTTLTGSSDPLVLIDGIPGSLNTVAPEDIESIDVLKDGSAAAIYGTRGTNGVIIITTKRFTGEMRPTLQYNGYASTQTIARRPDFLNAADYRRLNSQGYEFTDYGGDTDWFKEITRTPVSHVHNLTLQGGSSATNYTAALNYRDWQGMFLKSDNQQVTGRADLNHSMLDGKISFNVNTIIRNQTYGAGGDGTSFNNYVYRQAVIRNPTDSIRNSEGRWLERDIYFYDNPVAYINESNGENTEREFRLNGSMTVTPLKDLKLKVLVSRNRWTELRGYSETKNHVSTVKNGRNGYASLGTSANTDNLMEFTTDFSKTIAGHRFTVLGGYSYQDVKFEGSYMQNWDFPSDLYSWNRMQSGDALGRGEAVMNSDASSYKLIGFFGRLNYTLNDKYMVMASIRREGSSRFGASHKWGTFPGVSVGWRVNKEAFLENVPFVSDLKFRAGYGVTGIAPNRSYLSLTTLNYGNRFLVDGKWVQSLSPNQNPNPDLRWERKEEYNMGLDFGFFSNRINGSIDVYRRKTNDMLWDYQVPVPPYLFNTITANVGAMRNQGIEVLANFNVIKKKDFEWTTTANFSQNTNKLLSLSNELFKTTNDYFDAGYTGEPVQEATHRIRIGGPVGDFYGYKSIDVDEEGRWIIEGADGNPKPIADVTPDDKRILGNGLPKFYAGWNNSFRFRNWDLNVVMRGAFNYQILNFQRMFYENPKIQYNLLSSALDPVYGKAVLTSDQAYVSYYIEDGDFWKIDNATLGYTIPMKKSSYFKNTRVFVSGLNLLTITGYEGIDPEVRFTDAAGSRLAPGNDERDKYPTTRTFTFGVNLTL